MSPEASGSDRANSTEPDQSSPAVSSSDNDGEDNKPAHFSEGNLITLLIGNKKKAFQVYEQLLRDKAPRVLEYIAQIRSEGPHPWLNNIDLDGWRVFMKWLYSDKLPPCGALEDKAELDWDLLDLAYRIGVLFSEPFHNDCIDSHWQGLHEANDVYWRFDKLETLRDLNLWNTPLYNLCLKAVVYAIMTGNEVRRDVEDVLADCLDADTLREVIVSIANYLEKPWGRVRDMDPCDFHLHEAGVRCPDKRTLYISRNEERTTKKRRIEVTTITVPRPGCYGRAG